MPIKIFSIPNKKIKTVGIHENLDKIYVQGPLNRLIIKIMDTSMAKLAITHHPHPHKNLHHINHSHQNMDSIHYCKSPRHHLHHVKIK